MKWTLILISLCALSCREANRTAKAVALKIPADTLLNTDTSLSVQNGQVFKLGKAYAGYVATLYAYGGKESLAAYANGREEGWQYRWFPNGQIESKRYYHLGEKDSVHEGWWADGHQRFKYHFRNGQYHGLFEEWYSGGQPFRHVMYQNGEEQWAKGWRDNGKLFMNYVVRNGRRFGIFNAVLCYSLKNERGEFDTALKKSPAVETAGRF